MVLQRWTENLLSAGPSEKKQTTAARVGQQTQSCNSAANSGPVTEAAATETKGKGPQSTTDYNSTANSGPVTMGFATETKEKGPK